MNCMQIDLNSDLGEGCEHDAELMKLVTSANVCCGFHAGDGGTSHVALIRAAEAGVSVGAHPGFADREHFGRRELDVSEDDVFTLCVYQVSALAGLARTLCQPVRYLKPHGALYNMACRDERLARPIVGAAALLQLPILALPNSRLEEVARREGVPFFAEGFADRCYAADGSLVPRSRADAFVHNPEEAVAQAEKLIKQQGVRSLCVHGDNPQALVFVRQLREALVRRGFELRAFA